MPIKTLSRYICALVLLNLLISPTLLWPSATVAQAVPERRATGDLERSFQAFLQDYWQEIRRRNGAFLESVHPKLPNDMYEFFFDVTLQMMRFSDEQSLEPTIECQEFNVCKAIYPQPNDSWAAQRFILYESSWRWLDQ